MPWWIELELFTRLIGKSSLKSISYKVRKALLFSFIYFLSFTGFWNLSGHLKSLKRPFDNLKTNVQINFWKLLKGWQLYISPSGSFEFIILLVVCFVFQISQSNKSYILTSESKSPDIKTIIYLCHGCNPRSPVRLSWHNPGSVHGTRLHLHRGLFYVV